MNSPGSGGTLEGDALVLCTAGASGVFAGLDWPPLQEVRGQVSFCRATAGSRGRHEAHCHASSLTPAHEGVHCIGATLDRQHQLRVVDPVDDQLNRAELKRHVPSPGDHWNPG